MEDEPRGLIAPLKEKISEMLGLFSPSNISKQVEYLLKSLIKNMVLC